MQEADLSGANLEGANLTRANLYGTNPTGVILDGVTGANFTYDYDNSYLYTHNCK